ncbi:MAG: hypothetical protein OHK0050_44530 [Roseiflexaceae bacterium]
MKMTAIQHLCARAIPFSLLLLIACTQPSSQIPEPTQAPATIVPSVLPEPTTQPTNTVIVPTHSPTPTAAIPPTTEPTSLLPADMPWIATQVEIYADDEQWVFADHGLPQPIANLTISGDARWAAYTTHQGALVVANLRTDAIVVGEAQAIIPFSMAFAPTNDALIVGNSRGELTHINLADGSQTPLNLSGWQPPVDLPDGILMPIGWTAAGIYAQLVTIGSDTPPQGIVRIDPTTGVVATIASLPFYQAAIAPNGQAIALVTGIQPLEGQANTGMQLLDLGSGQLRQLVSEQPQLIRSMRWSPDSSQILYAQSASAETATTQITLVSVAGSPPTPLATIQAYRDLGWSDNSTPILLELKPDQIVLFRIDISSNPASIIPIMGIPMPSGPFDGRIVYTPQGF